MERHALSESCFLNSLMFNTAQKGCPSRLMKFEKNREYLLFNGIIRRYLLACKIYSRACRRASNARFQIGTASDRRASTARSAGHGKAGDICPGSVNFLPRFRKFDRLLAGAITIFSGRGLHNILGRDKEVERAAPEPPRQCF